MQKNTLNRFIKDVLEQMPADWLKLTTHRLDIYNEKLAKVEFLDRFESLYNHREALSTPTLEKLPTAYDYIRLGHPLSSVLEWSIGKLYDVPSKYCISFSSKIAPVLAILRKNLLEKKRTLICAHELPEMFHVDILKEVYGYNFVVQKVDHVSEVPNFDGSVVYLSTQENICDFDLKTNVDFFVNIHPQWGSLILVHGLQHESYISEIQHVRRRETIAMTPINCLNALKAFVGDVSVVEKSDVVKDKAIVLKTIQEITEAPTRALVGSSGLSIQYAIMMGLVHDALENHKGKPIKFVVPPNCYGGTNDQARRVAACLDEVEIVDLPVDGENDMVQSVEKVLSKIAEEDGVPYIIAEIPTNPRVEVPDLEKLKEALGKDRFTHSGEKAIAPVFILDQTFCPNVHFLGEGEVLSTVRAISYASGSKFPSGGKCTAGYCIGNQKAEVLMDKIELHLALCDNEATHLQYEILARQMPSMVHRIEEAYVNTREFVNFIQETLPAAKINFVSEELAAQGFTPSVFSLDLPTKGDTEEEKEAYKRALNLKLINLMITEIPDESKYCVSYGQLKGCYWTIPATSTQGTTKEGDKDYIARVALSPKMDLELHKKVFLDFVKSI